MDKGFICIKHDGFILKSAFFGNSPFLERTLKGTKLKTERKTKKVEMVSSVNKNCEILKPVEYNPTLFKFFGF